nr:F0F1 ATP synthase subunit epsilon [Pseudomonadota bacterium]
SQKTEQLFVAGGFAEVTATACTVLAVDVRPLSALDRNALEKELADLENEAPGSRRDTRKAVVEAALAALRGATIH